MIFQPEDEEKFYFIVYNTGLPLTLIREGFQCSEC